MEEQEIPYEETYRLVTYNRLVQYQENADPIFFAYQRGEKSEQEWLDAVQAVKDANPYPVEAK